MPGNPITAFHHFTEIDDDNFLEQWKVELEYEEDEDNIEDDKNLAK